MKASTAVANGFSVLVLVGLVAGLQLWGEHQRRREWWWIGGDPKGMLFLDLATASAGKGHVLSTDGNTGDEFGVEWDCRDKTVRWGAMWTRDRDFNQIERHPAPPDQSEWHGAKDDSERRVLEIACAKVADRNGLRSVKTERPPINATHEALEMVNKGADPHTALFKALGVD